MKAQTRNQKTKDEVSELVVAARGGDRRAFEAIAAIYKDKIYNYVSRMLRDPSEAQDVTQETFLRAYEALGAFRGASSFQTWLYRIASNLAIDAARGRTRRNNHTVSFDEPLDTDEGELGWQMSSSAPGPEEDAFSAEMRQTVQEAIVELSPKLRPVLILYDLQDMSYQEIAQILGCPLGTVKSRLFNARNQLREILEKKLAPEQLERM